MLLVGSQHRPAHRFGRLCALGAPTRALLTLVLCVIGSAPTGCANAKKTEEGRQQLARRVAEQLQTAKANADAYDFDAARAILQDLAEEVDKSPFADVATYDKLTADIGAVQRTVCDEESDYGTKTRGGWKVIGGTLVSPEDQPRAIAEQKRQEEAQRAAQEAERARRAAAEKPPPSKQERAHSEAGRMFLRSKLAELDSFKSDPMFHKFGFGVAGRFHSWLQSVESRRDAAAFSFLERVAVGDLQMLGLEYLSTRGRENDYTRYARESIAQAIGD